ncbi:DUF2490 domain-containing protein [Chryseobacterium sp. c4a]|uniref:DUF2490 domain-containing protein n=1 Tax=Chryseobacterium sp. c4a TaxID=1573582 RepID=UPI001358AD2A|nr:DUF2490 domain-containing protein [Chryseobacterium sp. c4a]
MNRLRYCLLNLFLTFSTIIIYAQEGRWAPWIMPAVIHRFDQKFSLMGQLAYTPYQNSTFIYLLGTYKLNKNISLSGGYFRLDAEPKDGIHYSENDAVFSGIISVPIHHISLEYRNMSMAVFPEKQNVKLYNRNRLRLIANDFSRIVKPYVFWEEYYSFNEGNWYRNRKSIGFLAHTSPKTQVDIAYILQGQNQERSLHLLFVQFLITI